MSKDYYEILGVSKDASSEDIKKAFRKKAVEFHPDRNKNPDAVDKFKEINEAYQVLSDDQKRSQYDRFGSSAFQGAGYQPDFSQMQFDMSDLFGSGFDSIFGDNNPFGEMFGGTNTKSKNRGRDIKLSIDITFSDVINAPEKEIRYKRDEVCDSCNGKGGSKVEKCTTCNGTGRSTAQITRSIFGNVQVVRECQVCNGTGQKVLEKCTKCGGKTALQKERTLKIRIPGGIEDGMNLRFRGEGNAGKYGSEYGDLFIEIRVKPEYGFKRKNNDLLLDIKVGVESMVLGDEILVRTFDGDRSVKIPAGMQPGDRIELKGLGIPDMRTKNRGSIFIYITPEIPKKLSSEEKDLYQRIKAIRLKK